MDTHFLNVDSGILMLFFESTYFVIYTCITNSIKVALGIG